MVGPRVPSLHVAALLGSGEVRHFTLALSYSDHPRVFCVMSVVFRFKDIPSVDEREKIKTIKNDY
jgi:hypothetical protein